MVAVGVRTISWYIWCNFAKFINCRTLNFIKSLYDCRTRSFIKSLHDCRTQRDLSFNFKTTLLNELTVQSTILHSVERG